MIPDATHSFDSPSADGGMGSGHYMVYNPGAVTLMDKYIEEFIASPEIRNSSGLLPFEVAFKSPEKNRKALTGNTVKFKSPKGGFSYQYFGPQGRLGIAVERLPSVVVQAEWWMDKSGIICRSAKGGQVTTCGLMGVVGNKVYHQRAGGKNLKFHLFSKAIGCWGALLRRVAAPHPPSWVKRKSGKS